METKGIWDKFCDFIEDKFRIRVKQNNTEKEMRMSFEELVTEKG